MHLNSRHWISTGHRLFKLFFVYIFNWMLLIYMLFGRKKKRIKSRTSRKKFKPILRESDLFMHEDRCISIYIQCLVFESFFHPVVHMAWKWRFSPDRKPILFTQWNLLVGSKNVVHMKRKDNSHIPTTTQAIQKRSHCRFFVVDWKYVHKNSSTTIKFTKWKIGRSIELSKRLRTKERIHRKHSQWENRRWRI